MAKVMLKFTEGLMGIAGFDLGRGTYEDQVKVPYHNRDEKLEVQFPDNITIVASSFVQGFFEELVSEVGYEGVKDTIGITSNNPGFAEMVWDRLY